MHLDLQALRDYSKWIDQTTWDVYHSVIRVGGWQQVFPGPLPVWASRIRQYFNLTPMSLKLLDEGDSNEYLRKAQTGLPASHRAKAYRRNLQSRGMGINFYAPGSSTKPGTPLVKPDPKAPIDGIIDEFATERALTGDVYEDDLGRMIWFQMSPGGAIYHFKKKIQSPQMEAMKATLAGQAKAPVFKLICPDGTGGSREVCIANLFGRATIGAVNEVVNVADRIERDSVAQGSYNYAETIEKGLPAHQRLDVHTDPMQPSYYVVPPNQFKFSELYMRRFPANDPQGKPLAAQTRAAP